MKELLSLTGGYKRHMDYLLKLQSEVMGVQNSLFKNLGHDLVLSGCEVTNNNNGTVNIAAGVVYIEGDIIRFVGANNVVNGKAFLKSTPVTSDPKVFQDTSTKNVYKETFAIVGDATNAATQIIVNIVSLYGVKDYIADIVQSYGQKGETKWIIDLDGFFLDNFDGSGLGITPKWTSWHLMNGNAGVPDMAGRSAIGVGALIDVYGLEHNYSNNQDGGQPRHRLVIAEIPSHSHVLNNGLAGQSYSAQGGTSRNSRDASNPSTTSVGGDQPHNIMQPFKAGYWVIKIA